MTSCEFAMAPGKKWLVGLAAALVSVACGNTVLVGQGGGSSGTGATGVGGFGASSSTGSGAGGDCDPLTCAELGYDCGQASDGCGDVLDCGTCPPGEACGASPPNVCSPSCLPTTCAQQGFNCGEASDGCGGVLDCGTCMDGECGGGGMPNVCFVDCPGETCAELGFNCGAAADGCGGLLECGTCPAGQTCGASSMNVCGTDTTTCEQACVNGNPTAYKELVGYILSFCACGGGSLPCAGECAGECADPSTLTAGSPCGMCINAQGAMQGACVQTGADKCQADPTCNPILSCELGC
jgi:hypothetical protein